MDDNNTARFKSKRFAVRIVNLYKYLHDEKNEHVMSKQILRSGTSIGANLAESETAFSRKDFASKIYIALKETCETLYWLEILHETGYLTDEQFDNITADGMELRKMLSVTTRTLQNQVKNQQ